MHSEPASRQNLATATVVERALVIADARGRQEAAAIMNAAGVNFSVIVRVLAGTGARRGPLATEE